MIIDQNATEVFGVDPTEFKIVASSKAFKILGDSLYQNKQEAVVRELSTNALDAQKEAGVTKPYELHIPTELDDEFRIRDFGTGLDAEQIEGLYTTYFQSTKDQSNEYIGALGLGSKSPFSCTDEFTVTSFKNGKMFVYLIKTVNDKPTYSKLLETETDQENGIEIKFVSSDCYKFQQAYQKVVSGFDPINYPDCNIGLNYSLEEIIDGVYKSSCGSHSSINIRMGQILYPITKDKMQEFINNDIFNKFGNRIVIDVPLGSVDIHPSRESLDYTEKTTEFLKDYLYTTQESILKNIRDQVDEKETIRQAAHFIKYLNFPLNLFSYKGTNIGILSDYHQKAEIVSKKTHVGFIESNKALELISPRLKYRNELGIGLLRKVVLVIRTKTINITHTLKHLASVHRGCAIIVVYCKNHTLIGALKRTYQEDLVLYTTCNKDLINSLKSFKQIQKKSTLIKTIIFKKVDGNPRRFLKEMSEDEVKNLKNTFSGTKRGKYITVTSSSDSYMNFELYDDWSILRNNTVGLLLDMYDEFTIVFGAKNSKLIKCESDNFFAKLTSGEYTSFDQKYIDMWKKIGYDFGDKKQTGYLDSNISNKVIKSIKDNCAYYKAGLEDPFSEFVIRHVNEDYRANEELILNKLKEVVNAK